MRERREAGLEDTATASKSATRLEPITSTGRQWGQVSSRPAEPGQAAAPVQRKANGEADEGKAPHAVAQAGTASAARSLPFLNMIQRSFGRHDVTGVRAEIGGKAAAASKELGADAYATGNTVAFAGEPDLHTAAHEAAHVVQQRGGVNLKGGVDGGSGDPLEAQANAVADAVVAGRSAEAILDGAPAATSAGPAVQRSPKGAAPVSKEKELEANVAIRVVAYDANGQVVDTVDSKGHWENFSSNLHFTGTQKGRKWSWDSPDVAGMRVNTDKSQKAMMHGVSVEQWAGRKSGIVRVEIFVTGESDVTFTTQSPTDSKQSAKAPGHAVNEKDGGNGSSTNVNPTAKGHGDHPEESKGKNSPQPGGVTGSDDGRKGHEGNSTGEATGKQGTKEGSGSSDKNVGGLHSDPNATELADELEQELAREPDGSAVDAAVKATKGIASGGKAGGKGFAGGTGERAGKDTSTQGTGPGGDDAKDGGHEQGTKGSETNDGSKGGDRDGKEGGSNNGRFGGEGKDGDQGVRGAGAWWGGVIPVPAALRGAVELGMLVQQGDLTGSAKSLFKDAAKDLVESGAKKAAREATASAAADLRRMIASEARQAAAKRTKAAIASLKADKAFNALTKVEQAEVQRIIYWESQRQFFRAYLEAAQAEKKVVEAGLKSAKGADRATLEARKTLATTGERAAKVEPVAGRLPQNHELAGELVPNSRLPKQFQNKGFRFKENGYPDYEPFARELPNKQKWVDIAYTGSRDADFRAANAACNLKRTPEGFTWHHSEEPIGRMYLIPTELHEAVRHTGGVARFKHVNGLAKYDRAGIQDDD